ncbi:hypothetical protein CPLU01_00366 [Colletotrichum plurivorum]|uniref:Uncharacterized protein n=1 Tax=Colletotrichum plurivorum TaxID=2175906 RepID=A0A8H6U5R2_9PEZI|nr:hypothetical protein CPLU01_00366 [Colletotrichum plurivorum]
MTATGRRRVLRAKARARAKALMSLLLPSYRTRFDCYCTFSKSTTPARAAQDATLNPAPRPYFRPLPGRNGSPLSAVAHCHVADRHPVPTIQCPDGRGPNPTAEWILQGSTEESGSSERDGGGTKETRVEGYGELRHPRVTLRTPCHLPIFICSTIALHLAVHYASPGQVLSSEDIQEIPRLPCAPALSRVTPSGSVLLPFLREAAG